MTTETYTNPILNADWSDPDVVRVGDDFYLTASSFGRAPGLPLPHSRDLVDWTLAGGGALPVPPRRGGGADPVRPRLRGQPLALGRRPAGPVRPRAHRPGTRRRGELHDVPDHPLVITPS